MPSHFSTLIRSACYQIAVASNSFDLSQATVSIHFYLYCDERTVEFILLYTVIEFQFKKRIQNDKMMLKFVSEALLLIPVQMAHGHLDTWTVFFA